MENHNTIAPGGGVEKILCRLDSFKNTGVGKWMACCPSHDDRNPSFSIRETTEGRILIRCFSGCTPVEILDSIGLKLSDLFSDNQIKTWQATGPSREAIEWARITNLIADYDRLKGIDHAPDDLQTIIKASDILGEIPTPPKPQGKPKLAPYSKHLADRQRYSNRPFMVVVCVGVGAWYRARDWSESITDIIGIVLPDCWPEFYVWPVDGCIVIIEKDLTPGDEVVMKLVQSLVNAGAWRIVVMSLGGGIERIYHGFEEVGYAAA